MPELPEVEALARFLRERAGGQRIERVQIAAIAALKTFDPPVDALEGRTVTGTGRRGKFLLLEADGLWLVVHLARAGWVRWHDRVPAAPARRGRSPLALRVRLASGAGFDITEAGTEKRLAVHVVRTPEDVPGVARLGLDPLDPAFGPHALGALLAKENGQLKGVLTTQSVIAGVGNAYSDEALHAARLSPFRKAGALSAEEVERLHGALVEVLREATERAADLPASDLKPDKRAHMRVHGRTGEPCPVCGDTVREVAFATRSLQYCPACQTGGKPLADRRRSRLLK